MTKALALTFHRLAEEIVKDSKKQKPSVERYTVSARLFADLTDCLLPSICCSVADFTQKSSGNWIIPTFDDGFSSDYEVAYTLLREKKLKATFFVTVKNIGKPGYLNSDNLKDMSNNGMEIGSHGLTHRYLITLPKKEAIKEIKESKDQLEQLVGDEVTSYAPVGGHFHNWMIRAASDGGYKAFATMIPGKTSKAAGFLFLQRNHIQRIHTKRYINGLMNGGKKVLFVNRIRYELLRLPKVLLGLQNYDRIKHFLMD
jgi:peptidoglycan/xylan/chitin deacetylase (PgdA/CDA1 family)